MADVFNISADPLSYSGMVAASPPVISVRAPLSTDIGYGIGQLWVNTSSGSSYTLGSVASGSATWNINGAGATGAVIGITGDDSSQEVPNGGGNFNILGTANQITTTGSTNTETLSLSSSLVAPGSITSTTGIAAGTTLSSVGATTLATSGASVNTFGNTTSTTSVAIRAGSGGLILTPTNGNISVAPATGTAASPTASVTMNDRLGVATFTGFTTASAATQDFTISNTTVATTSAVLVTVTNLNASTNAAEMGIAGITQALHSLVIHTVNNGAGALGTGDNVLITFWVLS